MAKNVVIGSGLIATALKKKLGEYGWFPEKDTKVIFYLSGPTHVDYEKNPDYHHGAILVEFSNLLNYCRDNNIMLIYPSSALVYEKDTDFAKLKLRMENWALTHKNTLGCRIFPVYGPGEKKTAITQWCRAMKEGRRPEIFGDGSQRRNFVYVDDVADYLIDMANAGTTGLVDIGTDAMPTFNEIVDTINKVLKTSLPPFYTPAPAGYSAGISSEKPLPVRTSLEEGIKKICEVL